MSVINVKSDGLSYRHNVTLDEYGRTVRTFEAVWTVLFDNYDPPINRPVLATTASASGVSIPVMWSTHPLDAWMYVYEITPSPLSAYLYEVAVRYKSVGDPLAIPAIVTWDAEVTKEPIDKDIDGEPITNSAKQPFDPPIEESIYDEILRIDRNEATFDHARASQYEGSVNSDTFFGFPEGKVLCRAMKATPVRAAELSYYQVNYEFVIREDGWKRRIKDQGLATQDEEGNITLAQDTEGNIMTEPVPLDGQGQLLAAGQDHVWLEFETKIKLPFSALGLA